MDQQPISMEIDTGAAVSIMNKSVFEKHYAGKSTRSSTVTRGIAHLHGRNNPCVGHCQHQHFCQGKISFSTIDCSRWRWAIIDWSELAEQNKNRLE